MEPITTKFWVTYCFYMCLSFCSQRGLCMVSIPVWLATWSHVPFGILCAGSLCLRGSLLGVCVWGNLCLGVSVWEVSVQGGHSFSVHTASPLWTRPPDRWSPPAGGRTPAVGRPSVLTSSGSQWSGWYTSYWNAYIIPVF